MIARRWTSCVVVGAGFVLLALAGAPATGRGRDLAATQRALDARLTATQRALDARLTATPARPTTGAPFARLSIPRLGLRWAVVQGVDPAEIEDAPGHYPQTALPGQVGNFAVAGHRVKGLFWDLDRLVPGDEVSVEYGPHTFTYAVTRTRVVAPTAVEVLAPVPGAPAERATTAALTLTTCEPNWADDRRLVVTAALRDTTDHPGET
ncbi:sortase [Asanoa sp. NPDC049573]|uniref:sortase n=1 Tax=Asanoa sp. NPDC049573 TaxID=3155396 RepID=UPI00343B649D